jgi:hypothetical protein
MKFTLEPEPVEKPIHLSLCKNSQGMVILKANEIPLLCIQSDGVIHIYNSDETNMEKLLNFGFRTHIINNDKFVTLTT